MNAPTTAQPLSPAVTRHDLLKVLALALMLVDHIGFFLFPEQLEWRAIGRASAPIWLFLVGYNRKSTLDPVLLACAAMMLIVAPLLTGSIMPVNILATIILVRVCLPLFPLLLMPLRGFDRGFLPGALLGCFAIALYPTFLLWEYGVFALLFAAWGWWCREIEDKDSPFAPYRRAPYILASLTFALYASHYIALLQLDLAQTVLMLVYLLPVALLLANFHAGNIKRPTGRVAAKILHFCGRQTLLLYVTHYVLLGLIHIILQ